MEEKSKKTAKRKIVVDTNIVFSGILNSNSRIGKLLVGSKSHFQYYSCEFLKVELKKHRNKLLKLTGLSTNDLQELEMLITQNIIFINEVLLPTELILSTETILADIDPKDTPFLALSRSLKAKLWTGDKKLIDGLKSKKIKNIISTTELLLLFNKLERI